MRVIHDPPYRPTEGKFRIIAEGPVNIGFGALQMLVAKMRGRWADRSTVAGVGPVARLCCRNSGCFLPDRSGPGAILTHRRHLGLWPGGCPEPALWATDISWLPTVEKYRSQPSRIATQRVGVGATAVIQLVQSG